MMQSSRKLQRSCSCGGSCDSCRKPRELRRHATGGARRLGAAPPIVDAVLRSPGQPLDGSARSAMGPRFGHDFSNVRIHADSAADESARAVNARAYTVGRDIVFGSGEYAPHTPAGRRLLAHELTHVVQQKGSESSSGPIEIGDAHHATEHEAESVAAGSGTAGGTADGRTLRRQPRGGGDDDLHRPMLDAWRRDHPGDAGASDADIKYNRQEPRDDLSRIRVDAVPDFVATALPAQRTINPHVSDASITTISWDLVSSDAHIIASSETHAGDADARTRPFTLEATHFTGSRFHAGPHQLRCTGRDANGWMVARAVRDFNVLSSNIALNTAQAGAHGSLTFTRYAPENASLLNQHIYGLHVALNFLPSTSVDCNDVTFIQSAQNVDPTGVSQLSHVGADVNARATPQAHTIDQSPGGRSPYYIADTDAAGVITDNTSLQVGHGGATPLAATFTDFPGANHAGTFHFETCAVCRSGTNIGQVYGCATWGFQGDAAGVVTAGPRSTRDTPSENFGAAVAGWNRWRAAQPAATQPLEIPRLHQP
jgi:hypothetical protein